MSSIESAPQRERSELFEGALTIAADACPELEREVERRRLQELAAPLHRLDLLRREAREQALTLAGHLSETCGFRGNAEDYYAPENSFINRVLQRRLGIPISLAVVYIEVARRVGVSAAGVGFPGHFLVRIHKADAAVMLDPFSGRILDQAQLQQLLHRATRGRLRLQDEMLQPTPTPHILARMLLNLRGIYRERADEGSLLVILDRLVDLLPEAVEHRRDRGLVFAQLGATEAAIEDLEGYLGSLPHAADAEAVRSVLQNLRQDTLGRRGRGLA